MTKELDISPITYNKYDKRNREPNKEALIKLADYYNVSLDFLVGRSFGKELEFLTREQYLIIFTFLKLNENQQLKVDG